MELMSKDRGSKSKITTGLVVEVITGILIVVAGITLGFVYLFTLLK